MLAKVLKIDNNIVIKIPDEIISNYLVNIGDTVELNPKDDYIELKIANTKKQQIKYEAIRIKNNSKKEYDLLEGSIADGL